jgi:hypothetical protein
MLSSTNDLFNVLSFKERLRCLIRTRSVLGLKEMGIELVIVTSVAQHIRFAHAPGVNLVWLSLLLHQSIGVVTFGCHKDGFLPDIALNISFIKLRLPELENNLRSIEKLNVLQGV